MQGPSRLRLMIADDDPVIRVVLEQGLGERFEIVGTAADTPDAISLAAATRPDVALVDVDMPLGGGLRAVEGIVSSSPATAIVVLSGDESESSVRELILAGAVAYCRKGIELSVLAESMLDAIHSHRHATFASS